MLVQMPVGLAIAEAPSGRIVMFNDEAERILGHPLIPAESMAGYADYGAVHDDGTPYDPSDHPLAQALLGGSCHGASVSYRRGDGATVELVVNAAPLLGEHDEVIGAAAIFVDVTEQRAQEERTRSRLEELVAARTREITLRNLELDRLNDELRTLTDGLEEMIRRRTAELAHLAHHDHLTGLPNRMLLVERLERAVTTAQRYSRSLAVLFIDLDGFKYVNDTFGHDAGDEVLQETARRLASNLRASDTLARLSGDEFVVLVAEMSRPEDARDIAESLLACLSEPFAVHGEHVALSASIGVSVFPFDASSPSELQRHADIAMYHAKESGKSRVRFYGPSTEEVGLFDASVA
jgi:diguanylate cyclase (GGDEF)-like protein